jgi:putative flippase GtrA
VTRHQLQGLLVFTVGLGITSGALRLLALITTRPSHLVEAVVLVTANLVATCLRFVLLREWVFTRGKARP